jgi:hypothetical protein
MLPEIDIWRSATAMIKGYGDTAGWEAANRADALMAEGEPDVSAAWRRIMKAIDRLRAGLRGPSVN